MLLTVTLLGYIVPALTVSHLCEGSLEEPDLSGLSA